MSSRCFVRWFWRQLFTTALVLFLLSCRKPSGYCGGRIPHHPALNPFAISFDATTPCADAPLIDAYVRGAKNRNGRFARSMVEHDQGIAAAPGDIVVVSVFFDNGGADTMAYTARNVRASVVVAPEVGTDHIISARLTADNAARAESASRGGDIVIHTSQTTKLTLVPHTI